MKVLQAIFVLLVVTSSLMATPYVPPERIQTHVGDLQAAVPQVDATFNHLSEFIQIAGFEQVLQCIDAGINFGGEREEEPGGGYWIIETDNTLEAIWVWSRYYDLTGDRMYNPNIDNAWVYAYNFPAWQEGAGYYSSHNCAWALAAERQYRETFNDSTHWDYAVSSANYILLTSLSFSSTLNVMVTGWCCGNLYLYGEATGNQQYMDVACDRAQLIIDWVEQSPEYRLGLESWAMSSGTFIWGICNSLFRRDPAYGQQWLATYGPMVQVFEPSLPSWSNAWNVAYCNAQGAMFDVTGDSTYCNNHLWLTNYLLHRDVDNDGGIPSSAAGSSDADASWTTSYLAMMGCDYYLGQPTDAGVLIILSPGNHATLPLNQPVGIRAAVGNWGTADLTDVLVTTSGVIAETLWVDLPAGGNQRVDFGTWTPTATGIDTLRVTVSVPGDTNSFNDSDRSYFIVQGVNDDLTSQISPYRMTAFPQGRFAVTLPQAGHLDLTLYNLLGQKVQTLFTGAVDAGDHTFQADLNHLPSGLYLAVARTNGQNRVQKLLITH